MAQPSHTPLHGASQQMLPAPEGTQLPEVHWPPVLHGTPNPTRGSAHVPAPSQTPSTPAATGSQGVPGAAKRGWQSCCWFRQAPNAAHKLVVMSAGKLTHTVLLDGQSIAWQRGSLPGLMLQLPSPEQL